jgi:pyruvate/2-oxoglutarate dehydrogenase complex dihydrolipoamide acyltransferase (E2) component
MTVMEPDNEPELVDTADQPQESAPTEPAPVETVAAEEPTAPAPEPQKAARERTPSRPGKTVSGQPVDEVRLATCVYKNKNARKTLSVYHVQRRLVELGYREADSDKSGWYGDLTRSSIRAFQSDEGLPGDGTMNAETLDRLFFDDPNVTVVD